MRKIAIIVSLIGCLTLPEMASAMPVASGDTVAKAANAQIMQTRGGCGYRRHRGPYGGCKWNRY